MKLHYDPETNMGYLEVLEADEDEKITTMEIKGEIWIHIGSNDGKVYGIKFLHPKQQVGEKLEVIARKDFQVALHLLPEITNSFILGDEIEIVDGSEFGEN